MCKRITALFKRIARREDACAVGIDWMSPCWLAVEIRGNDVCAQRLLHIREIRERYANADALLIDIPIGLPENPEEDASRPDREARNYLPKNRKPTVFPVPCRQAVNMVEYEDASAENARVLGKKLTRQSYAFSKTIRQVDDFLAEHPKWKNRLMESHPEVAFQILNGGNGLEHSKHTEEGIAERIAILQKYGVKPVSLFAQFKQNQYADILDAACLAVTAKIGCKNGFCSIPEAPVTDSRNLKMQMVFGKMDEA